jgi:hypothetical protein
MKRLSELPAEDRLTSRAHALIRAMGPTVESDERLRRVRRSLDAPARPALPRWGWRAGLALGLLGISAAAAAGSSAVSSLLGVDQTAEPGTQATAQSHGKPPPPAARPAPLPAERVVEPTPLAPPASPSAAANTPAPRAALPPISDVARVHEAAKALRHDRDPERALQLLERSGVPVTGPLAEEALALRIEASVARGDGRAGRLATAYLAQYPRGRYRDLAKRVLSGSKQ